MNSPTNHARDLAVLLRLLHREGYDDHVAGHITLDRGDGTFLMNPLSLMWDEVTASDLLTIDAEGEKLSGNHRVNPAVKLHVAVRRRRPDATVIIHNHPRWAGMWAAARRVPPIYDQTSAQVSHPLVLVDEYGASVAGDNEADSIASAFGSAEWALLANHGVLVVGTSIAAAYLRAITLEWRSRRAWEVETLAPDATPLPSDVADRFGKGFEPNAAELWWQAAARRELARDPSVAS